MQHRLTTEIVGNLILTKLIKLGIDEQQAPQGFPPVDPNHIKVLAVVPQCHKYSSNIFKLTFAPLNLVISEAHGHLGHISFQSDSTYTVDFMSFYFYFFVFWTIVLWKVFNISWTTAFIRNFLFYSFRNVLKRNSYIWSSSFLGDSAL